MKTNQSPRPTRTLPFLVQFGPQDVAAIRETVPADVAERLVRFIGRSAGAR